MDILKIRPSGRVSAGRQKKYSPPALVKSTPSDESEYICLLLKCHGIAGVDRLRLHLGLSSVLNLQKSSEVLPRRRRGQAGISAQGRQSVRDAVTVLEDSCDRGTLAMLTLTIPPVAMQPKFFGQWKEVARKLRQRLVYFLRGSGLNPSVVGVVEVQERRQSQAGELPALHWHLVFQGRRKGKTWAKPIEWYREMWQDLLEKALECPVECASAVRVECIVKSASGYLGKYMSKGVSALENINPEYLPSAWYMLTRGLLRIVKRMTFQATGQAATLLYEFIRANDWMLRFHRDIKVTTDQGREITIGWYGDLTNRDTRKELIRIASWIQNKEEGRYLVPLCAL